MPTQNQLIVEDGTGVSGANSFVSAVDAIQYLYDRGLITDDESTTIDMTGLLRRGLDAVFSYTETSDYYLPLSNPVNIPTGLINAQIWAAYYIFRDAKYDPATPVEQTVKRERVEGVVEIEYRDTDSGTGSVYSMFNVTAQLIQAGIIKTVGSYDRA